MTDMTDMKEKDLEGLDVQHTPASNHDDVFGELSEGGPNYRNVRAFVVSFAAQLFNVLALRTP